MLLRYTDDVTGKAYEVTIGTLDLLNAGIIAGTESIDLTAVPGSDLKTAFEAIVASPDGNAVTLQSARQVGRNL